jgi:cytochrome b561
MINERYSLRTRLLHWLTAAIVLWALVFGLIIAVIPRQLAFLQNLTELNVSLTATLIPFFMLRCINTLCERRPTEIANSRLQRQIKRGVHFILYAMTLTTLVSGVLMMDRPINVFGLVEIPNLLDTSRNLNPFHCIHRFSSAVLAVAVCLHIGAVIHHHRCGNHVMTRMSLRWRRRLDTQQSRNRSRVRV